MKPHRLTSDEDECLQTASRHIVNAKKELEKAFSDPRVEALMIKVRTMLNRLDDQLYIIRRENQEYLDIQKQADSLMATAAITAETQKAKWVAYETLDPAAGNATNEALALMQRASEILATYLAEANKTTDTQE